MDKNALQLSASIRHSPLFHHETNPHLEHSGTCFNEKTRFVRYKLAPDWSNGDPGQRPANQKRAATFQRCIVAFSTIFHFGTYFRSAQTAGAFHAVRIMAVRPETRPVKFLRRNFIKFHRFNRFNLTAYTRLPGRPCGPTNLSTLCGLG